MGKTSIINQLLSNPNLKKLVSCTTRLKRPGEIEGHTYYYIAKDEFNKKLTRGDFLQHSEFDSNFYGYDKNELLSNLTAGYDVIADLDYTALTGLKTFFPSCVTIFIKPPSIEKLQERLLHRGDNSSSIAVRLATYEITMSQSNRYDFEIVNMELNDCVAEIQAIIEAAKSSLLDIYRCIN
ncbi:guanylate kinase [Legionella quinlivanii DSM 21216]|nr:guanylate kinase [Legionella quinlivanii DSM 21216]